MKVKIIFLSASVAVLALGFYLNTETPQMNHYQYHLQPSTESLNFDEKKQNNQFLSLQSYRQNTYLETKKYIF